MTTKTFARNMGQLKIDPNQAGLVAGYDMVPRDDGTIEDLSGNGNHGTINGPVLEYTEIGPSMRFDGVDDYVEITDDPSLDITDDLTLSAWVQTIDVGVIIGKWNVTGAQRSFGMSVSGTGALNLNISSDGVTNEAQLSTSMINDGLFHYCVAVYKEALDSVDFYIDGEFDSTAIFTSEVNGIFNSTAVVRLADEFSGNIGGPLACSMSNPKIFTRVITLAEIQAEYQAGAKAVNFKTAYGAAESAAAESTPGELSNTLFRKKSGTHQISTDTINGCSNAKVIECVTAGVVQIPTAYFHGDDTQAAYGSNEFWVNKADASEMVIGFVSDIAAEDTSAIGYQLVLAVDESIELRRVTGVGSVSLMKTAAAFFTAGAWHSVKTTKTPAGVTTVYLDDTILDVTGGSGTNPVTDNTVTTSKHWVIGSDAGDKIAYAAPNGSCSIVKYEGIV